MRTRCLQRHSSKRHPASSQVRVLIRHVGLETGLSVFMGSGKGASQGCLACCFRSLWEPDVLMCQGLCHIWPCMSVRHHQYLTGSWLAHRSNPSTDSCGVGGPCRHIQQGNMPCSRV
jgi:hypothetical protein